MPATHAVAGVLLSITLFTISGISLSFGQSVKAGFPAAPITIVIGFSPGGGYDVWGRTLARFIGKNLPGQPSVIPQNMPGAGSLVAANYIYNVAPKDGSVMGIIARDTPLAPLTSSATARFDATKFSWVGTPAVETNVCIVSSSSKVQSVEDLTKTAVILGAVGPGSGSYNYPKALAGIFDFQMRIISGFPGSADVFLAMDRGEVDGMCESLDSVHSKRPGSLESKKLLVLFQGGTDRHPELRDAPFILDMARTEEEKQAITFLYAGQGLGRPFIAPPALPPGRLAVLRAAFDATMLDPEFKADVEKQKLELDPRSGAALEDLIKRLYATPPEVISRISNLIK